MNRGKTAIRVTRIGWPILYVVHEDNFRYRDFWVFGLWEGQPKMSTNADAQKH